MLRSRIIILLQPGIRIKRWMMLLIMGLGLVALGISFLLAEPVSPKIVPLLRMMTLGGLSPIARGVFFTFLGTLLSGLALIKTYRVLISGAMFGRGRVDLLTALDQKRRHERGMNIVAMGGGTGMSTLLRGLKQISSNITAIVTITDDGGSSGRLRQDLDMPPPGDARNCLTALSQAEPLLDELFNHRFRNGAFLNGHSLGNLLLAGLYEIHGGFHESLQAAAKLLALSGQVVPVSRGDLVLKGRTVSGHILIGESNVGHAPDPIDRVWIEPEGIAASQEALESIRQADLIVVGPGSLYTSIIPNFLVPRIREAVVAAQGLKVFVCNVATQAHETDGYDVTAHLAAFHKHSKVTIDYVLVNSNITPLPEEWRQSAVPVPAPVDGIQVPLILADLVDEALPTRHDPQKLAAALQSIGHR